MKISDTNQQINGKPELSKVKLSERLDLANSVKTDSDNKEAKEEEMMMERRENTCRRKYGNRDYLLLNYEMLDRRKGKDRRAG